MHSSVFSQEPIKTALCMFECDVTIIKLFRRAQMGVVFFFRRPLIKMHVSAWLCPTLRLKHPESLIIMAKIRCGGWAFGSWTFESNSNLNLSFWPHNIKHQVKNTIYGSPTLTSMSLRPIWIPPVRDRDRQHEWNLGIQGYGLPMSAPFPMLGAPWARMPMNIYSPHQVSYEYR